MHQYWVYMMTNKGNTVVYIGVTNDLQRRVFQHRVPPEDPSFCWKYQCWKLVWFEEHGDINEAIHREKQLKSWKRQWKNELVGKENASWKDLSAGWDYKGWFDPDDPPEGFYQQAKKEQWGGPELRDPGSSPG